jgi:hypothetical protein
MNRYFNHSTIRTAITAFGTLFSNFYTAEYDEKAEKIERLLRVPVRYLDRSKTLDRMSRDEDNPENVKFFSTFPRMSFAFTGPVYRPDRQLPAKMGLVNKVDASQVGYTSAPYDLNFELVIWARDQLKALEVFEQIIPWFRPNLNVVLKHEVFNGQNRTMNVTIDSVSIEDNNQPSSTRIVSYSIGFSVRTDFWGPVTNSDLQQLFFNGKVIDPISGVALTGSSWTSADGSDHRSKKSENTIIKNENEKNAKSN